MESIFQMSEKNQSWDHFHMHKNENTQSLSDPI